jgi:hypothetical protein
MRARITAKSSATGERVTVPPQSCFFHRDQPPSRLENSIGTRIELPKFRDATGILRSAITLPDEIRGPIGDAVLAALIERGIAKRRFIMPMPAE